MTAKLIVDLGEDGSATVSTVAADGELPSTAVSSDLSWPLDDDVIEDLRWYLEDYLIAPFGVYEDRGARIKASLGEWGKQVFTSLFGSGPARDAYLKLRALSDMEIVFRSSSPSLLGLPWELMADPGQDHPLALETAGVSRSLQMAPDAAGTVAVPGGRLRVLMVIARPAGSGDVGYRMIARPLLERLDAVRGSVDLVVLRPPTLEALRAELDRAVTAGEPYQVVHFDGHGVMPGRRGGADGLTFAGPPAEGELVFEKPGGGADHVPSSRVAQVLADAKVPVVVLNACQSGAVGKELEAAVATRLLRAGVASVVGMAYTVYAVAAAEFMAAFYERLFAGGTVSAAVTAGRQQMFRSPGRPSPKGSLPLEDWLVPVHYLRRDVSFPQSVVSRPAELSPLAEALEAVTGTASGTGGRDLDAVDRVFIGRDALFYGLEAAVRRQKVVVLTGTGGTGKTELAKAFARWWRDTGGVERPDWVFWHSFEPGVASFGLDGVVSEIGWSLYGREFLQLDEDHRRAVVLNELKKRRMLLVWDNFESVRSMPDTGRATPPLDEEECAALREFLVEVAAGDGSSVLITSRTTEDWLGDVRRIQVGGLLAHEAAEYADVLLAPSSSSGAARRAPTSAAPGAVRRSAPTTETQKFCGSRSSRPAGTHATRPAGAASLIQDRNSTVLPLPGGADTTVTRAGALSRSNSSGRATTPPAPGPATGSPTASASPGLTATMISSALDGLKAAEGNGGLTGAVSGSGRVTGDIGTRLRCGGTRTGCLGSALMTVAPAARPAAGGGPR